MNRLYLLDTNTIIYIFKGKSLAARTRLAELSGGELAYISAVTQGELLYSVAKSGSGEAKRKALEWFLARIKMLAWGRAEADAYATLRFKQEQLGRSLGPLDTQIAAHAIAIGAILVTNDKAFQQVESLPGIENWATDLR